MEDLLTERLPFCPAVFAVEKEYQIYMLFTGEAMVKVAVGDRIFYDDMCGVMRSGDPVHRVHIPMGLLDAAGEYTVIYQSMIERKAYFPQMHEEVRIRFTFRPVPKDGKIRIYHIADAHSMVEEPVAAGQYFGGTPDLLVLNGDIPNHAGAREHLDAVLKLASGVGRGECPIICTRGNHDTRGRFAEEFLNYIPHSGGRTYYTVRVGSVWALVLDCGEDKDDGNPEYGGTACFHPFRLAQTEFIKQVIANAAEEYEEEGVTHRLVISHVPFTYGSEGVFAIEAEIYSQWAELIHRYIHPQLMLCGHRHVVEIWEPGCKYDTFGQACPVIIGSDPLLTVDRKEKRFIGCAVTLDTDSAKVVFNDHQGNIKGEHLVKLS